MEGRVSGRLAFFSELLTCGQNLYYWEFDPALNLIGSSCPDAETVRGFLSLGDCKEYLLGLIVSGAAQSVLLSDILGLSWIAVFEITAEQQVCRIHMIGPAFNSDVSLPQLQAQLNGRKLSGQFMKQLRSFPVVQLTAWFQYGLMLHYAVTGEKLTVSDFNFQVMDEKGAVYQEPAGFISKSKVWLAEQEAMQMIEEGRLDYQNAFGELAAFSNYALDINAKTPRKIKNAGISLITLCTRAAIRGGLDIETAHYIGEYYVQKLESAALLTEIIRLTKVMYEDFINRVHKCRAAVGISKTVQACINYITLHLEEEISLKRLAAEVGYAEYYLLRKFKKETGCTITRFIKEKKIERAKFLLASSKLSILQIGENLGFCNNSYFIKTFRQVVGMTPGEYRGRGD
jgi:AraC-like DNA-binding protein